MTTFRRVGIPFLVILLVAGAGSRAQTTSAPESFSFKGNPLGMTLADFKLANASTPCFTKEDVAAPMLHQIAVAQARSKAGTAKFNVTVLQSQFQYVRGKDAKAAATAALRRAMQDSDDAEVAVEALEDQTPKTVPWTLHSVMPASDGINCSSGDDNQEALQVGSFKVSGVVYQFSNGRLYKITILFPSGLVLPVKGAFTTKYGESAVQAADDFQNNFGARWTGANFAWINGTQSILLHEGANNGPGGKYDAGSGSVTYKDRSLEPIPDKVATNF
jgi:hypothetical protein